MTSNDSAEPTIPAFTLTRGITRFLKAAGRFGSELSATLSSPSKASLTTTTASRPSQETATMNDITTVNTNAGGAPAPWHQGVDNAIVTHWQQKGYDLSDPKNVAIAASKGYLEAEKFIGVPPHRLLKLPENVADEVGWSNVWQRLGAPAEKTGYDFSQVKFADGTDLDAGFTDMMRDTAHSLHLPTSAAVAVAKNIIDFMQRQDHAEGEQLAGKLAEEKAQLNKDWGNSYEVNRQTAAQGAAKLGVKAEEVAALEKVVGYSRVMEMFRKVGAGTTEDAFINGNQGGQSLTTAQTAQNRLNELMANPVWCQKLSSNDPVTLQEFHQLTRVIA